MFSSVLFSEDKRPAGVGPLETGGFLLNSGWVLRPAGHEVDTGSFPMSLIVSRDGKYVLVLSAGAQTPSVSVIDAQSRTELQRLPLPDAWLGLTMNAKGDRVYVAAGAQAAVYELTFAQGRLTPARTFPIADPAKRTNHDFAGDVTLSPDGRMLYAANLFSDSLVIINPLTGYIVDRVKTGRRPYRILFAPDGKSYFVTNWADGSLARFQASDNTPLGVVRLGSHPTDLVWRHVEGGDRIYVTASNTNSVYVVRIAESGEISRGEALNLSLYAEQPLGMMPSALALTPDGKTLYALCSGANAIAQVDLSQEHALVTGFIPTGWYPTAVALLPDGTLVETNGLSPRTPHGTVSLISPPNPDQLDRDSLAVTSAAPNVEVSSNGPQLHRIKHVVYIVKGGRTYDEVLGDVREGNGSANARFGESVTPNLHKLARDYVLLDNFYVNGENEISGLNWSAAAAASDFVEKLSPSVVSGRLALPSLISDPGASPPAGYLWSNARLAGLAVRNYGFWASNKTSAGTGTDQLQSVADPQLAAVTDLRFRGPDSGYPDVERAREFVNDLATFAKNGSLPQLLLLRLGNDQGSTANGDQDSDAAIGIVVEAISKSKFWPDTAIFIVEAWAGDGQDHVDRHRAPAWLVSPFVKRHSVDRTMYNTTSVLRTIEAVFDMRPMTQFDASAMPMLGSFGESADATPFDAAGTQRAH